MAWKRWYSNNRISYVLALSLVMVLGILGIAPTARATPVRNKIWNGYVTKTGKRTKIIASWHVPTLKCGTALSNASQWIGLAGVNAPLVQIGIESICSTGIQYDYAFYQVVPKQSSGKKIIGLVTPGDLIDASVKYLGGHKYRVHLMENAWSWDFTKKVTQPDLGTAPKTAEWIVEAGSGTPLSKFGRVHFENAFFNNRSLTNRNARIFIADTGSGSKTRVTKISQYGGHGPNFSVKWLRS